MNVAEPVCRDALSCARWLLVWAMLPAVPAPAELHLGPEELVQAGGADVVVPGYSVPSCADWNNDTLKDLIVGEGGSDQPGRVRVYLNVGENSCPQFSAFFYAQSEGSDLTVLAGGCQGSFPRVVHWDDDGRKDLLVGLADGTVQLYLNTGTDSNPTFGAPSVLQFGPAGSKTAIDVGLRACSIVADWNADGRKDLVVGAYDGMIHVFLNEGTDFAPDFRTEMLAQNNGQDMVVDFVRSSPELHDFDGDGKQDLISGNTDGKLLLYRNVGTASDPSFAGFEEVKAGGIVINLPGAARSRPFLCDWNSDGLPDVLLGGGDGMVHLYKGFGAEPPTLVGAVSRKTHGAFGDFDIELPFDPGVLPAVEGRIGGPARIVLTFSEPVEAVDGQPDQTEVQLSAGTLEEVVIAANLMTISLSAVPNETCLRIELSGIADPAGNLLSGSNNLRVVALLGDRDGDRVVDVSDFTCIKQDRFKPADPQTFRSDMDCDGVIDVSDLTVIKVNRFKQASSCP